MRILRCFQDSRRLKILHKFIWDTFMILRVSTQDFKGIGTTLECEPRGKVRNYPSRHFLRNQGFYEYQVTRY